MSFVVMRVVVGLVDVLVENTSANAGVSFDFPTLVAGNLLLATEMILTFEVGSVSILEVKSFE